MTCEHTPICATFATYRLLLQIGIINLGYQIDLLVFQLVVLSLQLLNLS